MGKTLHKHKSRLDVIVVDDEIEILHLFSEYVTSNDYNVKTFKNPCDAVEYIKDNRIHCVFIDYKMREMLGTELAKQIRQLKPNLPIIMVTGFTDIPLNNLEKEKVIYKCLKKPIEPEIFISTLQEATYAKFSGEISSIHSIKQYNYDVILIGSSTGGPKTLVDVLKYVTRDAPPIVVVQHIQENFQVSFSKYLGSYIQLQTIVVENRTDLQKGCIYFAPPDRHIGIETNSTGITAFSDMAPPIKSHRPSVDFLFKSAATTPPKKRSILAFILTGMGDDGAEGMLQLYKQGHTTIAQGVQSSTVFGMPRVAIDIGAVSAVANSQEIADLLQKVKLKR